MSRDRSEGGGFIALWRSARESELHFTKERRPATRWEAREDLWLSAAYEDERLMSRDQPLKLDRGQVLTSIVALADRWRWSRSRVERFLNLLEAAEEIAQNRDNRRTVITICNFDKWQIQRAADETPKEQQTSTRRAPKKHVEQSEQSEQSEQVLVPELFLTEKLPAFENGAGFDSWWRMYPRKEGRAKAKEAWERYRKAGTLPPFQAMIETLAWQIESEQWNKDGGEFIPHGSTYMNQRRFEDERPSQGQRRGHETPTDAAIRRYWEKNADFSDLEGVRPALPGPPVEGGSD